MKIFLDCEFNGFGGSLISVGMVSEDGIEFYQLVDYPQHTAHPWVRANVLPVIGDDILPVSQGTYRANLQKYLNKWGEVEVIADWPQDLQHFFESLYMQDQMIMIPKITTRLVRGLKPESLIPHNALEDAKALKQAYLKG